MLRKSIFTLLFSVVMLAGFAQSGTVNGNTHPLLKEITVLKEKAEQVNAAHALVANAATGSRNSAQSAKIAYDKALQTYLEELQAQLKLNTRNATLSAAIEAEIAVVQKIQSGK